MGVFEVMEFTVEIVDLLLVFGVHGGMLEVCCNRLGCWSVNV
jgi:hypothetical protein